MANLNLDKGMGNSGKLVDLSHEIFHGLVTYPGLPAPEISEYLTREDSRPHYAPGTEFTIGRIEMVANTGTYLDSPYHRYAEGADLAGLPLESLANLDGLVVRPDQSQRAIDRQWFESLPVAGKAVLVNTGWDRHWGTEGYFGDNPFLTKGAVRYLVEARAALVGIDSLNIDDTRDGRRPAHSHLLKAGIPIVEHLTGLGKLPESGFSFFAVPVKVRDFGSFPVRAFAIVQ